jgi:hypothetical protein
MKSGHGPQRSPDEPTGRANARPMINSAISGDADPHIASLMAGYDVLPHSIHPVASALAHTGIPFVRASSAIDMWS